MLWSHQLTFHWTALTSLGNQASGYFVYRDGAFYAGEAFASPSDEGTTLNFADLSVTSGMHTYSLQPNNTDDGMPVSVMSKPVSVTLDTTTPTIKYSASPVANAEGWNKDNVTVTFSCSDDVQVASCSSPVTLSTEGAGQTVTGTAVDEAGNSTSVITSAINIDKTPPTASGVTLSSGLILLAGTENISASVNDTLSGVTGGECYVDSDPGQGRGTAMAYSAGKLTASKTFGLGSLSVGSHTLYVRSQDKAGNWSTVASRPFTYL